MRADGTLNVRGIREAAEALRAEHAGLEASQIARRKADRARRAAREKAVAECRKNGLAVSVDDVIDKWWHDVTPFGPIEVDVADGGAVRVCLDNLTPAQAAIALARLRGSP